MSMDMTGGAEATDYSSFEYQYIQLFTQLRGSETTADEAAVRARQSASPLEGAGGLDNNEVAELVGFRLYAKVANFEDTGTQTVPQNAVVFGGFGINLPATPSSLSPDKGGDVEQFDLQNANSAIVRGKSEVDDRVLDYYQHTGATAFNDSASGTGGGSSVEPGYERETNFRQLVGRGPVLDSTDDLTLVHDFEIEKNSDTDHLARVDVHCIWDVAEVSDAGRAFSVPSGMN